MGVKYPITLQECKDWCTADLQCKSFAYNPSIAGGKCFPKKKCGSESEPTRTDIDGWKTYYQPCHVDAGGIFRSQGAHTSSGCKQQNTLHECKDLCTADLQCKSFAYNPSGSKCCMFNKCGSESEPTFTHLDRWKTYYEPCNIFVNLGSGTNSILSKVRFPISYNLDRDIHG